MADSIGSKRRVRESEGERGNKKVGDCQRQRERRRKKREGERLDKLIQVRRRREEGHYNKYRKIVTVVVPVLILSELILLELILSELILMSW